MAIVSAVTTSFKVALLSGEMDFSSDTTQVFKLALYTSAATLGASTTAYSTSNEVAAGGEYSTGGKTITISTAATSSGTRAFLEMANVTWASSTITARGGLIYSTISGTPSVCVLDFGSDVVTSGGNFVVSLQSAIGDILSLT